MWLLPVSNSFSMSYIAVSAGRRGSMRMRSCLTGTHSSGSTSTSSFTRMMPMMSQRSPAWYTGTREWPEARMASRVLSSRTASVDSMKTCGVVAGG